MNRKQLIILLALVAVLGGAGLVLMNRNQDSWSGAPDTKQGRKLLENFQVNDVVQIRLVGDSELNLVRNDDLWRVRERGDYPANFSQISGFLMKLSDLKITQSEQIEASQIADLGLVEPKPGQKSGEKTATLIETKDSTGKVMRAVLLGNKHTRSMTGPYGNNEYPDGRYVMLREEPKTALLISDPLGTTDPKPDQWLNKDFFKVEKIKSVAFTALAPTNSWTLAATNEGGTLVLQDCATNEFPDSAKISSLSATLGSPSFVDVATNASPEVTGLDKPLTANIETFGHFTYVLKVGKKTPENNYFVNVSVSADLPKERTPGKDEKPEDKAKLDKEFADKLKQSEAKLAQEKKLDKWTYLVSSYTIDPLVRDRAQLMQEKKDPKVADAAALPKANDDDKNQDFQDISTEPAMEMK